MVSWANGAAPDSATAIVARNTKKFTNLANLTSSLEIVCYLRNSELIRAQHPGGVGRTVTGTETANSEEQNTGKIRSTQTVTCSTISLSYAKHSQYTETRMCN